jgi:hypothetical protein
MKLAQKFFIFILFVIWPAVSSGQNWMMAHKYLTSSIDSLIHINWPNTGNLAGYGILYMEYDDTSEDYTIVFIDTIICSKLDIPLKAGEQPDSVIEAGELVVNLSGGVAAIDYEDGDYDVLELPDLSEAVYIFNEAGRKISFSLSNDDKSFESCTLQADEFYYYPCNGSEFAYIKLFTMKNGTETGSVHYKLEKTKGYKVKYDSVNSKFEVYTDERMDYYGISY